MNSLFYRLYIRVIRITERSKIQLMLNQFDIHPSVKFNHALDTVLRGNISIGKGTYINSGRLLTGQESTISIGKYCAIGHNVTISAITHDLVAPTGENIAHKERDIVIGDNVWIGSNVFIREGVEIGHDVVIGANSFVGKSVPQNTIVGGVPAQFISHTKAAID